MKWVFRNLDDDYGDCSVFCRRCNSCGKNSAAFRAYRRKIFSITSRNC